MWFPPVQKGEVAESLPGGQPVCIVVWMHISGVYPRILAQPREIPFPRLRARPVGLLVLPGLLAIQLCAQGGAQTRTDPRIGSWTLISAQSSLTPPNKLLIAPLKDDVHVVMSGETTLDFTAKANGHGTPVPNNPGFDRVELHRVDRRQSVVTETKAGAVVATVRDKLSPDGHELTIVTEAPGKPDQITVWTRSGGPKVAHDPLAGEWTEDLSKTRLRQGLVLKIEAGGSGAVRFSGDYSYTARFDGKNYDVQNSRNDTVTLALSDPHTVDATFRRDDQVSETDRWVVSADGQQMTLTSTATFETGQHLTEKLAFKKQ